jgi:hypothetical protein
MTHVGLPFVIAPPAALVSLVALSALRTFHRGEDGPSIGST